MIKNYFKIAWRNIIRHKAYSAINIAGLSIGIAACLLIFVVVKYERSFDTFQPNYKNLYHVVTEFVRPGGDEYNPGTPALTAEALRLDFPQAKIAALQSSYGSLVTVNNNGNDADSKKFTENTGVLFLEPQFFDLFTATWLQGSKDVLAEPNMAVISKATAIKYFGDWKLAMGKSLKMDNVLNLKVAGIVDDMPANSDFPLKVLISYVTWVQNPNAYGYTKDWGSVGSAHQVFMLLPQNVNVANINAQLKKFYVKHAGMKGAVRKFEFLQPLADIHFDTRMGNTLGDHVISKATINTLSLIAVLIIIMASINFINLSTAQSVGRSKEVGIRKVLGSSRGQLVFQVLGETTIIVAIATILAIGIAKLGLPYLKDVSSVPDTMGLISRGSVLFLIASGVAIVLLSGIYPAVVVSGFKPVLAIKNKITAASIGGIPLRRALVVTQFAISQLLIIGTIIAVRQMDFVNSADLGFAKDAILMLPTSNDSLSLQKMTSFKQALLQNPAVKSVTFDSAPPSSNSNASTNFFFDHSTKDNGLETFLKYGDADYFKTYQLHFVAGRGYDASDTMRQVVVNETFLNQLGIKRPDEALGKTMRLGGGRWAPIVGVVKDFKTNSLRDVVKPVVIFPQKIYETEAAVKIQTGNLPATVASIQKLWENTYPDYAYNGFFLDSSIADFYKQENQLALVYKIFAAIAIFISCLGLYGLVSFMVLQRTKEVGVRKVLGASVANIVYLFSKEFMLLIALSFVIAMPAGWYMMDGWLRNFAYRINLTAGVFILAIAASVIVAWATVGYKAVKAAIANPVKSLRSE